MFGYLRGMDSRKRLLLGQRLKYLFHGNFHGVSANWLAKQTDGLFSGISELVTSPQCPVNISLQDIAVGEKLFSEIIAEKSGSNFGKILTAKQDLRLSYMPT